MGISVRMRAQVTVEIELGNWTDSESFASLSAACKREAIGQIRHVFTKADRPLQIVGEPRLLTILAMEERA